LPGKPKELEEEQEKRIVVRLEIGEVPRRNTLIS
jgi:hypothetical protein